MGEAKRRGTKKDRCQQAIFENRIKYSKKSKRMIEKEFIQEFMPSILPESYSNCFKYFI